MSKNKKIIYGIAAILVISAATAAYLLFWPRPTDLPPFVFSNDCDELKNQINELIANVNCCLEDTDCAVLSLDFLICPFGCYLLTNKEANIGLIEEGIKEYVNQSCPTCLAECPTYPETEQIKCIDNKCVEARFEAPSQEVTITTDKAEYSQGEVVKITVKNNLETPIWYAQAVECDSSFWQLETCQEKAVLYNLPCEWVTEEYRFTKLASGQELTGSWSGLTFNGYQLQPVEPNCYKIVFPYSLKELQPIGEPWSAGKAQIYSNEFRIK